MEFHPTRFDFEVRPLKLIYPGLTVLYAIRFNSWFLPSPNEMDSNSLVSKDSSGAAILYSSSAYFWSPDSSAKCTSRTVLIPLVGLGKISSPRFGLCTILLDIFLIGRCGRTLIHDGILFPGNVLRSFESSVLIFPRRTASCLVIMYIPTTKGGVDQPGREVLFVFVG